jgi:hypothetical protein
MRPIQVVRYLLLAVVVVVGLSAVSPAQVRISVNFGPPALPVYELPPCPGDGFLWTPGYWAWDPDDADYYWVPGTWVEAPDAGLFWTPPYWGWDNGAYIFYDGYWGPHVGFYGGIDYGFGYFGLGFVGGRWDGGHFFYNTAVLNVSFHTTYVYNERINNITVNHVSFNGGPGGIDVRPRPEEEIAARDRHVAAVSAQMQHIQEARSNRDLRASVNNGRPSIAATARPGDFHGNVIAAREAGGEYHPPANRAAGPGTEPHNNMSPHQNIVHPKDLPPLEHPAAPNTGNAKMDKKYQQQQDKLYAKQNQDRQKLQQRQEQEDQRQQKAAPEVRQQTEQRHQQQTQQMVQQHTQQTQHLQQRQAPPHR